MTLALPLAVLLAIIVYLLVRSGELRTWQVVLVGLLGFYLARTHLADPIGAAVTWLITGLTHT
ncbi:hypothetical protein P3T37_006889 [Kitasatospora sp. MAA4]|uniref:hypothetical protein n=1 Tax=Kitasatospora sp. MAA4 TaxID=3035093 RepID=UPI00247673AF|nr:hypothetical protein [Kitasatospora sp. MAA4]MDH6137457.1 hypothetical protein [Kitasatospora sp. MAA4]